MKNTCCVDTNVLLDGYDFLEYDKIYCPIKVLEELDNLKVSESSKKAYKARKALRVLKNELKDKVEYIVKFDKDVDLTIPGDLDAKKADNIILLSVAKIQKMIDKKAKLLSYDMNMIEKAKALEIKCEQLEHKINPFAHKGFKEVVLEEEELANFYENLNENIFDCVENEYLLINDKRGNCIDKYKWTGNSYKMIKYKAIKNDFVGNVKPRNRYQELAMDLLQDDKTTIKVLSGVWGSGKDFLMASSAINMIGRGKYDKIIWIRNNVEVKNSNQIGFLPGSMNEKLLPYAMVLADHLGGEFGLQEFIRTGKVELQHLGFVRGRDLKNSIIICSEAENMTREHLQLLISRMGENTMLWVNGDYKQVDDYVFENSNGLIKTINLLRGNELFGHVALEITERSKSAELASLLDEEY